MPITFNSTFGKKEISINCPLCKSLLKIRLNQVGNTITCPFCRKTIELQAGNNFESNKKQVNKAFKNFEKELKNIGK